MSLKRIACLSVIALLLCVLGAYIAGHWYAAEQVAPYMTGYLLVMIACICIVLADRVLEISDLPHWRYWLGIGLLAVVFKCVALAYELSKILF